LTEIFKAQGKEVHPRDTYEFEDPTVIMPGTKFMERISGALEYYIRCQISRDPWWKDIKVWLCLWVFSSPFHPSSLKQKTTLLVVNSV
jgi:5'-3' exoribonuclease 2